MMLPASCINLIHAISKLDLSIAVGYVPLLTVKDIYFSVEIDYYAVCGEQNFRAKRAIATRRGRDSRHVHSRHSYHYHHLVQPGPLD